MTRTQYAAGLLAAAALSCLTACDQADNLSAPDKGPRTATVPPASETVTSSAAMPSLLASAVAANVCAAVAEGSARPGATVVTAGCDSTQAARRFALQPSGLLTTLDGSMCLDVLPPKAKGAAVVTWGCSTAEATQRWTQTAAGELTNVQGLCLTIAHEDAERGRPLVLWPCNGGPAQKWTAGTSAAAVSPKLLASAVAANVCAAVADGATRLGTTVLTAGCDSTQAARRFALQPNGLLTTLDGARCVDVAPPKAKGAAVVTWGCSTAEATQRWTQTAAGELTNVQGLCLTIAHEDAERGRPLVLWPCNGGPAQKWTVGAPVLPSDAVISPPPSAPGVIPDVPVTTAGAAAELPRVFLNTQMPMVTGRSIAVPAGGNLQAALDAAQPGDEVVLAAGATFTGNFVLAPKANAAGRWIVVRSGGALPAEGTRVAPGDAPQLAKVLTPNFAPAFETRAGAQGWRLVGLDIGMTPANRAATALVLFGSGEGTQNVLAQVPSRLVLDRSYVHAAADGDVRRCVALNSASTAVIDSYLTECHSRNGDSQAIAGWNGPGPFKIVNNRLEGGHEVIAFGGADPAIADLVPSDVEVRRNHVTRPLSWRGVWGVKNLVEFKAGRRLLFEGNVFENSWADGQSFAFMFWSVNPSGGAPWTATEDITFRYNRVRNIADGFNLAAKGEFASTPLSRVTIAHNVVTGSDNGKVGRLFQVLGTPRGITIANNTGIATMFDLVVSDTRDQPLADLVYRNNVTGAGAPLFTPGGAGPGLLRYLQLPAANVAGNVIYSGRGPESIPAGNTYVASLAALGFADLASGNVSLSTGNPLRMAGTGASTPGADLASVVRMTQDVVR